MSEVEEVKENSPNLDLYPQEEPNFEMKNIPGFDVLDNIQEEQKMKSYNDEFYNTLSNLKFLSLTIPNENQLFYHFEKNNNASITSTTGQIFVTVNELKQENINLKKIIEEVQGNIEVLKQLVESAGNEASGDIHNEIINLEKRLQLFIVESKTEKFKLIKELAILKKEKNEIYSQIQAAFARVEKLEKELGKNKKRLNKLGININKNNVNNDKTFMETKSFNNTFGSNKDKIQTESNL
jgi:predicted RNase H-like nuclease (RuvC/YqgF family)